MELTGEQLKKCCDALLSAYPNYDEFERLVRFSLDENLASIAIPCAMNSVVFKLVSWAQSHGRVDELLAGALELNPKNPALLGFAHEVLPRPNVTSNDPYAGLRVPEILTMPKREWMPDIMSPAALLRAEFGIVPFHAREREIADLASWSQRPDRIAVRLYTGMGGMGKTRLMLEMCKRLQTEGWAVGFVEPQRIPNTTALWSQLVASGRPIFAVCDYAETHCNELLAPMLEAFFSGERGVMRVILLARAAGEWWDQLRERRDIIGDVLAGPASQWFPMRPLALDLAARAASYEHALDNFARMLGKPTPAAEEIDLADRVYDRVLLLHMRALAAVEGVNVKHENGILDYVLRRERRFWRNRCMAVGLNPALVAGVGQAVAVLTLGGGAVSRTAALEILGQVPLLSGQPPVVLDAVAGVLHDALAGDRWIEPLQPDILGEHLVESELNRAEHRGHLLDLIFGPADLE